MNRGEVVTIALPGAYGKPRPAVIVQSDLFSTLSSATILPITSELRDTPLLRTTIEPSPVNGLRVTSQIMIDKAQTVPRGKIGARIGTLDSDTMMTVNRLMAIFLGIA